MKSLLAPGGVLFIEVPGMRKLFLSHPIIHTEESIAILVREIFDNFVVSKVIDKNVVNVFCYADN